MVLFDLVRRARRDEEAPASGTSGWGFPGETTERTMNTNPAHAFALLIGVDNYRAYEAHGASDLPGSVNDVIAWREVLLRRGFAPENIRVLASPTPEEVADLGHATGGAAPATMENI